MKENGDRNDGVEDGEKKPDDEVTVEPERSESDAVSTSRDQRKTTENAWKGFGMVAGINIGMFFLMLFLIGFLQGLAIIYLLFIGVAQLIYVIPIYFIGKSKGMHGIGIGITIAASITFLLNAGCYGLLAGF